MSWNSTHSAIFTLGAIVIASFHYAIDLQLLVPIIAPLGAYIALREKSRIKKGG